VILLAVPFGLVIGLIVGAVGGGGAILALPVLVYVLDEPVGPATTASLIVVAVAASAGAGSLARHGSVCWRLALTFSGPAAAGSLLGTVLSKEVSGKVLILAFVPVMLAAAFGTWQRSGAGREDAVEGCPSVGILPVAGAGLGVGILTGFFGVGGGFVIVPVLVLGFKLAFRRAVATSLVIITLTGVAALVSHLAQGAHVDLAITVTLAIATATGALAGTLIGDQLPQRILGRAFAVIVASVALFLLVDTLVFDGPPA
jgi:uncharacterized membrane protein YfcA